VRYYPKTKVSPNSSILEITDDETDEELEKKQKRGKERDF